MNRHFSSLLMINKLLQMKIFKIGVLALVALFMLLSCDPSLLSYDWNGEEGSQDRKLSIRLTDEPIDAEEVNVEIEQIIIKTNEGFDSTALETVAGIYNLLDYQDGVDTLIGNAVIDFENIKEIRLILGDENTIKVDGEIHPLNIPSGSQTGLKIKVNIDVSSSDIVEILIDFDALKSIIKKGNGEYQLKPVLSLKRVIKDGEEEEGDGEDDEDEEDDDEDDEDEDEDDEDDEEDDDEDGEDDEEDDDEEEDDEEDDDEEDDDEEDDDEDGEDDEEDDDDEDEEDDEEDDEDDEENSDLTETMINTVNDYFPGADISSLKGNELCDGTEILELKINFEGENIFLIFDNDGSTYIANYIKSDEEDLAENIVEFIETEYDGYKIKKVYIWTSAEGSLSYELEIQKQSDKKTLVIDGNLDVICD